MRRAKDFWTKSLLAVVLTASSISSYARTTSGIGSYAQVGTGTYAQSIWWLDFSRYNDNAASGNGQNYRFNLPNNAGRIYFQVTNNTNNNNGSVMQTVSEPAWSGGGAFGNGAYQGIAGSPIFYWLNQPDAPGIIALNNIKARDGGGHARTFAMEAADGENTDSGESITYVSDSTWSLIDTVNYYSKFNGSLPTLSGTGSGTVYETGASGGNDNASYVFETQNPQNVSSNLTNNEGVLFGISLPQISMTINVNGRLSSKDQFSVKMGYVNPSYVMRTTTTSGSGTSYSTGYLSVLGTNDVNMSVSMANGSSSSISAYGVSISCSNSGPGAASYGGTNTVLPSGAGTSFDVIPQTGDMLACTINISSQSVDHYEVEFSPSNSGLTCMPTSLILRACSNATSPCVNAADQSSSANTLTLSSSLGAFSNGSATDSWTFVGQTTDSLSSKAAGTAVLATAGGVPTNCFSGSTLLGSCSEVFSNMGFVFNWLTNQTTSAGAGVVTAGSTSAVLEVSAVQQSNSANKCVGFVPSSNPTISLTYADPTSGTRAMTVTPTNSSGTATAGAVSIGTAAVPLSWDINGNSFMTVSYKDSGEVNVGISTSSPAASGATTMVSKPYELLPYSTAADVACSDGTIMASGGGSKFCASQEPFSIKIRGYATDGTPLPNFGLESALGQFALYGAIVSPAGGSAGILTNVDSGSSAAAGTGVLLNNIRRCVGTDCYSLNNVSWSDVSQVGISVNLASSYFGSGTIALAPYETVGRFYPYAFVASNGTMTNRTDLTCSTPSSFSYMDEPFQESMTLTAVGKSGGTTTNYGLPYMDPTQAASWGLGASSGGANLSSRLSMTSESGAWSGGTLNAVLNLKMARAASPDGPYRTTSLTVNPIDSDGVKLAAPYQLGTTDFLFGMLAIGNASGSDLLPLPIQVYAEYWNQYGFATNSADGCTTLQSSGFSTSSFIGAIAPSNVSFSYPGAFVGGGALLTMNPPTGGTSPYDGSFVVGYSLPSMAYLAGNWGGSSTYSANPYAKVILSRAAGGGKELILMETY